ncbi:bifunctional endoribonuclease/protein kinase ire1, partial [Nowakowskiella sp. JEL0078]
MGPHPKPIFTKPASAYIGSVDGTHYLLSTSHFPFAMIKDVSQRLIDAPDSVCEGKECAQDISLRPVAVDPAGVVLSVDGSVCTDASCIIGLHGMPDGNAKSLIQNELNMFKGISFSWTLVRILLLVLSVFFFVTGAFTWREKRKRRSFRHHVRISSPSEVDDVEKEMPPPPLPPKSPKKKKKVRVIVDQGEDDDDQIEKGDHDDENIQLKNLRVSTSVLGYGSHGTVVFKGTFEGRDVAIKRLLLDFYDVASREVTVLQESDDHPNVVRYYFRERTPRFMYIALELCPASLSDLIERPTHTEIHALLRTQLKPQTVLRQIISGVKYLHSLQIVHRDIKPQNILVAHSKSKKDPHPRILVSDFGLSKRLADDQSSFHNTVAGGAGTTGWRAPEILIAAQIDITSNNDEKMVAAKFTKKIDIFSAGCLFYYIVTAGEHPFGDRFSREANVLRGAFKLDGLGEGGAEVWEVKDLIKHMISKDPQKRPNAEMVLRHPYFWTPSQRLAFLQDASDRFEIEERDPPSSLLRILERNNTRIIGHDWQKRVDRFLLENLGKYRKYDGATIRDLLRALRNKDLPADVQKALGPLPEGFLRYFESRFPGLLLHVYYTVIGNP